jgi:hypothetical protein
MTTYNRKYYLIRKLKADGWKLLLKDGERTIVIPADKVKEADDNEIISELMYGYGFGAQIQRSIPEPPINRALIGYRGLNLNFPNPPMIGHQELYNNTSSRCNVAIGSKPLTGADLQPKRVPFFKRLLNKIYAR